MSSRPSSRRALNEARAAYGAAIARIAPDTKRYISANSPPAQPYARLVQIPAQFTRAVAGIAKLAEDARLDLADTLSCDAELFGHFFQSARAVVSEAVAHLQYLPLSVRQLAQDVVHLLLQHLT